MAAIVLQDDASLTPAELEDVPGRPGRTCPPKALAALRPDRPRRCPRTATNKVLKRELIAQGPTARDGVLWVREERGTAYAMDA